MMALAVICRPARIGAKFIDFLAEPVSSIFLRHPDSFFNDIPYFL